MGNENKFLHFIKLCVFAICAVCWWCCAVKVDIDNIALKTIVNAYYPDIRKIINTIQGSVVNHVVKLDESSLKDDLNEQIIQALSNKAKLSDIRQILAVIIYV